MASVLLVHKEKCDYAIIHNKATLRVEMYYIFSSCWVSQQVATSQYWDVIQSLTAHITG